MPLLHYIYTNINTIKYSLIFIHPCCEIQRDTCQYVK